jgi:Ca-activated chloride channel homolog
VAILLSRRCAYLLLPLLLCRISVSARGDEPVRFRTTVSEVQLSFSALDQNDHGVATLQASDFAVVDKGFIVRDFQSFTRSDWTRLELAILVDASASATPLFRQEIAGILELVSQTAGIPDENVSIFSFQGVRPALLCSGDCRATNAAPERLSVARAGGLTPLYDAVVFASDFLSQHGDPHAQKVLIVFSDGEDTISRYSLTDAIDAALVGNVQIYGIDLNHSACPSPGAAILNRFAGATGGRYFPPQDGASRALNVILEGFRATYIVSYRLPSHASGFHAVRVFPTHNLNLEFRCRSGYYYPYRDR